MAMREKRTSGKDSTAPVSTVPWDVVSVRALGRHRLLVRCVDGTEGVVDVRSFIFSRRPGVFEPLQDPKEFAKAYVDNGVVTWPGGLDMAPDAMYQDIVGRRR